MKKLKQTLVVAPDWRITLMTANCKLCSTRVADLFGSKTNSLPFGKALQIDRQADRQIAK